MEKSILRKRGVIILAKDTLESGDEILFKALFSVFFPVAILPNHDYGLNSAKYYGYSPFFDEINEFDRVPEYQFTFKQYREDGVYRIEVDSVNKITTVKLGNH